MSVTACAVAHSMYLCPKIFLWRLVIASQAWAASEKLTYASPVARPADTTHPLQSVASRVNIMIDVVIARSPIEK